MPKSRLIVPDFNYLHLDIHTIGYPNEGESLLTLLCDGNKVLFSVLTDCYEYKHYNHAKKLLNELQVKQIDIFIWSHPHQDHSVGIPKILDEFDPDHKAEIYLPSLNEKMVVGQKAIDALDFIKKHYFGNRNYNVHVIQVPFQESSRTLLRLNIEVLKPRGFISYSHHFFLPKDLVLYRILDSANPLLNDLSIVYSIEFNGFSFFFCGDLSERNVRFIDPAYFRNTVFINIPHHGSDNIKSLVPIIKCQGIKHALSTSTAFKRHHLPKAQVLKDYCTISDSVYCTSNPHNQSSEPYGCITAKFSVNMKRPEIITTGNAYCFFPA